MVPSLLENWISDEDVVILEMDRYPPDRTTLTPHHLDNLHLDEAALMAEAVEGAEAISAFAIVGGLQTTATRSGLEIDHRLQDGVVCPGPIETIGDQNDVTMIAGLKGTTVSASLTASEETLPRADLTPVRLLLISKHHCCHLLLIVHRPSNHPEMIQGCVDLRPLRCLVPRSRSDATHSLSRNHRRCHCLPTTFLLAELNHQPLVMVLVLLHLHLPLHKCPRSARCPSNHNRIVALLRMFGKHHQSLERQLSLQRHQFRLHPCPRQLRPRLKHNWQHLHQPLLEPHERWRVVLRLPHERRPWTERLLRQKQETHQHLSHPFPPHHGHYEQTRDQRRSLLHPQSVKDAVSLAPSRRM